MGLDRDVLKGVGWEATFATVVVEVASAINELLLGQWGEVTVLKKHMGLEGANGGEGPAAAAR